MRKKITSYLIGIAIVITSPLVALFTLMISLGNAMGFLLMIIIYLFLMKKYFKKDKVIFFAFLISFLLMVFFYIECLMGFLDTPYGNTPNDSTT
ncbi:MAG: O-antigen ligase [Candidatus Deianiraeaceae bacterium]|jgi:O-antigen ligase